LVRQGIGMKTSKGVYNQSFSVSYDYPVHFTRDVFSPANPSLKNAVCRLNENRRHRVMVFVDAGVEEATPGLVVRINRYFRKHSDAMLLETEPELVPGGEKAKNNRDAAEKVMESIADHRLCRQSCVIAVGGGSALDIIGLAASLVHRGLRLIRIPTTVLSQDDSGVGVKNGIDAYGMKNFAGTFAPPFAVVIDFDFLKTLDHDYWVGGIAEAFKVAIIKDAGFFRYLLKNAGKLARRDEKAIEQVVRRSAIIHLDHIRTNGDPFEFGSARPLDFGHWCAHKLEILSGYEIGHGQAVAIGIALDSYYAFRRWLLTKRELDAILVAMKTVGLPIYSSLLERKSTDGMPKVIRGLKEFQEHLGGRLTITLPDGIGRKVEIHEIKPQFVLDGIRFLKTWNIT
jgi:3-dehydroquinate synthase